MAKQMVVAHATKYTASSYSSGGIGRHIDRKHVPDNADQELQDQNFELVDSQDKTIREKIGQRIEEGYKGKRAVRKDAVIGVGVIFSGSTEQMNRIKDTGNIYQWAQDTFDFAAERWGKDNIVRATVHMDETAPHMHLHFVPLTEEGRLSAKQILSRGRLKSLQEDYGKAMEVYGLGRGIEGSKQQHITTKQYHQKMTEIAQDSKKVLEHPEAVEMVESLMRENEELKRKQYLKEQQELGEQGKKEQIKKNPDKANGYAEHTGKIEPEQNKFNRAAGETKQANRGPKI